jgi:methylated-DNA-[protein]-cysteine S-methyltransferase
VATLFSTQESAAAALRGVRLALSACNSLKCARSIRGGGCFSSIPDARELRPPQNVQVAIEGITALLRGAACDFAEVALDMAGIPALSQRVYAYARSIPRGETRTYAEIASALRASGAAYSVAQAIGRNPFMIIVPCHRVLEAGN